MHAVFFFFPPNPQNGCNRIDPFGFVGIKSVNEASILRTVPGKCNLQFKVDGHRCLSSTVKKGYSKCYRQRLLKTFDLTNFEETFEKVTFEVSGYNAAVSVW